MQLIPVLEIRHGHCVQTEPKNAFVKKVVNNDPAEIIKYWISCGIESIHIVDVDAIEQGEPINVDLIASLNFQFPLLKIQASGGIKNVESAFIYIDAGVDYLVLSSRTLRKKSILVDVCIEFKNKVIAEIDTRNGLIGYSSSLGDNITLQHVTEELAEYGVNQLIITDIPESGHVNCQNIQLVNSNSSRSLLPVYANGGINSPADLEYLIENKLNNLSGLLLGKVIYDDNFNLASAVKAFFPQQLAG